MIYPTGPDGVQAALTGARFKGKEALLILRDGNEIRVVSDLDDGIEEMLLLSDALGVSIEGLPAKLSILRAETRKSLMTALAGVVREDRRARVTFEDA